MKAREARIKATTLIWSAVLLLAVGAITGITLKNQSESLISSDAEKLRRVFIAWQLYREDHFGSIPPNLLTIRYRLQNDMDLRSVRDGSPEGEHPIDPFLPNSPKSLVRVSFAYAPLHMSPNEFETQSRSPKFGLIANPWPGGVSNGKPIGAVQRLSVLGSITVVPQPKGRDLTSQLFLP